MSDDVDNSGFGDDCDTWFDAPSTDDLTLSPSTPRGRSPDSGIVAMPDGLSVTSTTTTSTASFDSSDGKILPPLQLEGCSSPSSAEMLENPDSSASSCELRRQPKPGVEKFRRPRSVSDFGVECLPLVDFGGGSGEDRLDGCDGSLLLRRSVSSDGELTALSADEDDNDAEVGRDEKDSGRGVVDQSAEFVETDPADYLRQRQRTKFVGLLWKGCSVAEARLAARRAARAEARQIRLKELERRKKEQKDEQGDGTEDDSGAPVTPLSGASSSCGEPPPPPPPPVPHGAGGGGGRPGVGVGGRLVGSAAPSGTGSLSSGSRRSSQDSLNEETKDLPLGLRELRQEYRELEDRFNKAMILNAQMDNEKAGLMYQVENLKDIIIDLRESLLSMQKENKVKSRECDAFRRAAESLKEDNSKLKNEIVERDRLIQEVGLVMVYSEELDEQGRAKRSLVTHESAQLLDEAGEGSLDARIKKFAEEKNELQDTIRRLNLDLEEERNKNAKFTKLMASSSPTTNGPSSTDEWIDVQKENNRLVAEYKAKVQRSEQEIVTLQANVSRLESQVTRYKTSAEAAEKNEEELKMEKRKLLRELKTAQDRADDLETAKNTLLRQVERLKRKT